MNFLSQEIAAQQEHEVSSTLASLDQPINLLVGVKEGLRLFSIPGVADENQEIGVRDINRVIGFESILGVYRGHLLTLTYRGRILITDLEDGDIRNFPLDEGGEVFAGVLHDENLYLVQALKLPIGDQTHTLVHVNLSDMKVSKMCTLSSRLSNMQRRPVFRIAASPDGSKVAVCEMQPKAVLDDQGNHRRPLFRIVIAAPLEENVIRTAWFFRSRLQMTGAGDYLDSRAFVWADRDSLLVDSSKSNGLNLAKKWPITKVGASSGKLESFAKFEAECYGFEFASDLNYQPIIETNIDRERKRFGIDLENESFHEIDLLANPYRLVPTEIKESYILKHNEETLEIHAKPSRVFPTEDGQRVAWLALPGQLASFDVYRRNDHGVYFHGVSSLKIYDSVHGVRNLGDRWYNGSSGFLCLWLSDDDLKHSDSFDRLPNF